MLCPYCKSDQLFVVNSRDTRNKSQTWRRRKCIKCSNSFTTYERINLSYITVVKKDGNKQRYSRAKLYSGIYHSTIDRKNIDRGEMSTLSEEITTLVEQSILGLKKKVVTTSEITDIVKEILWQKSPGTLLRYIAYREENNHKNMIKTIKKYF